MMEGENGERDGTWQGFFELMAITEYKAPNPHCFFGAGDSTAGVHAELRRVSIAEKIG